MAWFELLQILHGDVGNVVESGEVTSNLCRRWLRALGDHLVSASMGYFEVELWELPTVERLDFAASLHLCLHVCPVSSPAHSAVAVTARTASSAEHIERADTELADVIDATEHFKRASAVM